MPEFAVVGKRIPRYEINQAYLESHASLAMVDPSGKITIWTTTQASFVVRSGVAEALQVPMTQIRIIPTEIGGGFGGKIAHKLEVAAALLARKTGKPVQMVMTREEDFQVASPRHPCHMIYKRGSRKMAPSAMGVDAADVSIRTLDTDQAPHTAPSAGSQLTRLKPSRRNVSQSNRVLLSGMAQ